MGNTTSQFKDLPLASQEQHPLTILGDKSRADAASTSKMTITPKGVLSGTYFVTVHDNALFTVEFRSLASKCTIHDPSGSVIATVRGCGVFSNQYTVHAGESDGKRDPATPAAMTVKRCSAGLEVSTATGITLTVAFGSSSAYIFLGSEATTTAPLITRVSSSGTFKTTYSVELAAGIDAAAVLALWAVMEMVLDAERASAASNAETTAAAAATASSE
ncbi:hypothetical protein H9P43_009910 [Blastocladiella emersonii ATCC 22665]|nr:hypothetical protein H9P43_009910 [Blastocladiella emersonii ATCC 22665]